MKYVYIALFGLAGVFSRYFAGAWVSRHWVSSFPWGTFLINISGSFVIGVVFVLGSERAFLTPDVRTGLLVGLLGGYTTFSSYCLDSSRLLENGEWHRAASYFLLSPLLGLAAAFAGLALTRTLLRG